MNKYEIGFKLREDLISGKQHRAFTGDCLSNYLVYGPWSKTKEGAVKALKDAIKDIYIHLCLTPDVREMIIKNSGEKQ
jgi:hypothetical protein